MQSSKNKWSFIVIGLNGSEMALLVLFLIHFQFPNLSLIDFCGLVQCHHYDGILYNYILRPSSPYASHWRIFYTFRIYQQTGYATRPHNSQSSDPISSTRSNQASAFVHESSRITPFVFLKRPLPPLENLGSPPAHAVEFIIIPWCHCGKISPPRASAWFGTINAHGFVLSYALSASDVVLTRIYPTSPSVQDHLVCALCFLGSSAPCTPLF